MTTPSLRPPFHPLLPCLCVLALLSALTALPARANPSPQQTAACVAVLKLHSNALARQVNANAGQGQHGDELFQVLRQGAALIGAAYLDGYRNEAAAKARLEQAEQAAQQMPAAQQAALRQQCGTEADALLRGAPAWQRAFIDGFARRRMDRLLAPKH